MKMIDVIKVRSNRIENRMRNYANMSKTDQRKINGEIKEIGKLKIKWLAQEENVEMDEVIKEEVNRLQQFEGMVNGFHFSIGNEEIKYINKWREEIKWLKQTHETEKLIAGIK